MLLSILVSLVLSIIWCFVISFPISVLMLGFASEMETARKSKMRTFKLMGTLYTILGLAYLGIPALIFYLILK